MSLNDVNYCHVVTEGSWTVFPAQFQPQMAYEITIGRCFFIIYVELVDSICSDSTEMQYMMNIFQKSLKR